MRSVVNTFFLLFLFYLLFLSLLLFFFLVLLQGQWENFGPQIHLWQIYLMSFSRKRGQVVHGDARRKEREQVGVELTLDACFSWGARHKLLPLNLDENLWGINPCARFIHQGDQTRQSPATCLRWGSRQLWWDVNSDLSAPSMTPVRLPRGKVFHANQNIWG